MTLREDIESEVLAARDNAAIAHRLSAKLVATAVNAAFERVGQKDNNDIADLIQIAALVMIMAETTALNTSRRTD